MSFEKFESTCPACHKEDAMAVMDDRGVEFLGCSECFGLFVSEGDLADYVRDATEQEEVAKGFHDLMKRTLKEKTPKIGKRQCPVCKEPLGRLGFGESPFVILDRCPEHGVWLDKKELKKVIRSCRAHSAVIGLIPRFSDTGGDDDDDRKFSPPG
jgi:Zn-finger nucleic acid-binding protein